VTAVGDERTGGGGLLARFARGLARTREALRQPLAALAGGGQDRAAALRELRTALVASDVGVDLAGELLRDVEAGARSATGGDLRAALRAALLRTLDVPAPAERAPGVSPRVVFYVGVNGTGKTTTIGKHAAQAKAAGQRPLLAACDTFRAAAIDQLAAWADRAGVGIVRQAPGADPAAVLHDALSRARERGETPVLVDTAGRLHVKTHLMDEVAKMSRVASRLVEGAPHEALLVIDATTGQNGLAQAREFGKVVPLSGLVLTKLDGTASGGIGLAIVREFGVPVRWVGVGEGIDDLAPFDAEAFVDGLLGSS
jgi:fused signal recognition particle receptor